MRKGALVALILALALVATTRGARAQAQFGPWIPMRDGNQNGISISFKISKGYGFWKLKNTYPFKVKVQCEFGFTDLGGKVGKDTCGGTLEAGEERSYHVGDYALSVSSVNESSMTAKVSPADAPPDRGNSSQVLSFPGNKYEKDLVKGPEWTTYAVGKPLNLSDGIHSVLANKYQYPKSDPARCPDVSRNGRVVSQVARFQNFARFRLTVSHGIIISSSGDLGLQDFLGCLEVH